MADAHRTPASRIRPRRYMSRRAACSHPPGRAIAPDQLLRYRDHILRFCHVCRSLIDCGLERW